MSRPRIRRLGVPDLHRLPPTCPTCPIGPERQPGLDPSANGAATWARAAEADWGFCGLSLTQAERIVAYLLVSSPLHVPRAGPQSGFGLNPDAAVVMSIRVLPEYAGSGFGRQLVQAAAARMTRTQFRALEVRGSHTSGACAIPPVDFLEAVGFHMIDPHPLHPRLRLEFSRTARWAPNLAPALDRVLTWARPLPPAEPASRTQPQPRTGLGSHS
ncbi:MAG: GNAT family N-acetyltransferase [Propionibacteriaceae bacterium]|nr:GNAT family N-acetyltransferase [Propionibacteriaceae bacterium]